LEVSPLRPSPDGRPSGHARKASELFWRFNKFLYENDVVITDWKMNDEWVIFILEGTWERET
jgi:hypothetical protein